MKVFFVDGTEKEIELKKFLSGAERSRILDRAITYNQEGAKIKGLIRAGELMSSVVKAVLPAGVDFETLTAESFDAIFSKYDSYFNQSEKKTS